MAIPHASPPRPASDRHRFAVFALLRAPDTRRVLLVRRRRGARHWTLPGGKARRGESLTEALVREVCEETGLTISPGGLVSVIERASAGKTMLYFHARILATTAPIRGTHSEIVGDGWFDPAQLPSPRSPALRLLLAQRPDWAEATPLPYCCRSRQKKPLMPERAVPFFDLKCIL